jgi:predicted nucleic acid-binding protein
VQPDGTANIQQKVSAAVTREITPSVPDLPEWIEVRSTKQTSNDHIYTARLGAGKTEAICLGLESPDSWIILDDWRALTPKTSSNAGTTDVRMKMP